MWVMPPPAGWLQPSQLLDPQQMPHIDFPVLSHPCGLLGLSPGQLPSTTIITEPHASQENVLFLVLLLKEGEMASSVALCVCQCSQAHSSRHFLRNVSLMPLQIP